MFLSPTLLYRSAVLLVARQEWVKRAVLSRGWARRCIDRFVAGESLNDAIRAIVELQMNGCTSTLDVLGEDDVSETTVERSIDLYLEALDALARPGLEANVSLKPTQFGVETDESRCLEALREIVRRAAAVDGFVRIDMEDHRKTDVTLRLTRELRREFDNVGVVLQAYLHRTANDVQALRAEGVPIRLCKGAYREPRTVALRSTPTGTRTSFAVSPNVPRTSCSSPGAHSSNAVRQGQRCSGPRRRRWPSGGRAFARGSMRGKWSS